MMTLSAVFFIVGIYSALAVLVIVTSLLYDIQIIRLKRAAKRHPYAAWRRARPQVAVVISGSHGAHREVTAESIMANRYAHKKILTLSQLSSSNAPMIAHIQAGDVFSETMLRESIEYMQYYKSHTYNIAPALSSATTAGAAVKNYLHIADQVFSKMRTVLTVASSHSITTSETDTRNYRPILYRCTAFLIATMTSFVILISTYFAVVVAQPTLLLGIALFLGFSLLVGIIADERLTPKEKVFYCVLAPISFPVFYTIGILSPLFRVGSFLRSQSFLRSFGVYGRS